MAASAAPPLAAQFAVAESDGRAGALVTFPFDRALLDRFRETFPRARFRRKEARWFVPGTTAERRLDAWIAREVADLDAHADAKGRDAYSFEPLAESPYLRVGTDLVVRTPYDRAVVDLLRAIPFARFDGEAKAWHVPFRSYETLRARWPAIEAAAREAEPEARRLRRAQARAEATPAERAAERRLQAERRRRRAPVALDALPPLGEPVATPAFGVVVFDALDAEPIPSATLDDAFAALHPGLADGHAPRALAWGWWRMPTWREVRSLVPAADPGEELRARGWWAPTADAIEERRRRLREGFRARAGRRRAPP
jgi:hypothetical protein